MDRRHIALACLLSLTFGVAAPAAAQTRITHEWRNEVDREEVEEDRREDRRAARDRAEDDRPEIVRPERLSPFEREFAVAVYGTGHAGSYFAGGIGGRLRWEPFEWLGLEAYLEATIVEWPGNGFRHDYPNGFNLYVPIRVDDFRFRPFFGFCDVLSFVEPEQEGAPRADDVMFGLHAGIGVEYSLETFLTLFADLQGNGYLGHDRTSEGWTGGVEEEFSVFWNVQLNVGVQAHFGER